MAALTRQHDLGDAQGAAWLRADPVSLRPDMTGARLVAWSNLGLSSEDADALMQVLRPLFGDSGMQLSAGAAERWYLHVAREAPLPSFAPPGDALGDNLIDHLPPGPEGKRWRALMNEAQILLHNHPVNAQRLAAGLAPANSLWFWGGGVLPDRIATQLHAVDSLDPELRALAAYAGLTLQRAGQGSLLIDKRHCRDWARFEMADLQEALSSMGRRFDRVQLDFGDGASFVLRAVQRWRFWRPALAGLGNDG